MHTPDTKPGPYFITATPDSGSLARGRVWVMAGPYADHAEALEAVDHVRETAIKHDPRAHWMLWGTARIEGRREIGRMNAAGLI